MSAEAEFFILEKLLEITGLVIHPSKNKAFFHVMTAFTSFSCVYDTAASSFYWFEDHTIAERIENFQLCVVVFHLISKAINLRMRNELMWKIINSAKDIWKEMNSNEENRRILENISITRAKGQIVLYFLYFCPGGAAIMSSLLRNALQEKQYWKRIFCLWNPFRVTLGSDWYWSIWFSDVLCMSYACFLFLAVNTALYVSCMMAKAQMMVLIQMLQSENLNVRDCIVFHQKIVRYVMDLKDMFTGQMALEIVCSALQISPRVFLFISELKNGDPHTFETAFFLLACIGTPVMICYCGHIVTEMSQHIFIATYQNRWYNLKTSDQKMLYSMMVQASKLLEMEYAHVVGFNMEQLGRVLQGTYSYMTILSGAT